jgi:hypothetical protein
MRKSFLDVETESWMFLGTFMGTSVLAMAGPVLVPLLCWNKIMSRIMVLFSAVMLLGFAWTLGRSAENAFIWILASQALHLIGCLFISRPYPEIFSPAPPPDA